MYSHFNKRLRQLYALACLKNGIPDQVQFPQSIKVHYAFIPRHGIVMKPSTLPYDNSEFDGIKTPQGKVMVSTNLLVASCNTTDESWRLLSYQNQHTKGIMPATYPTVIKASPNLPGYVAPVGTGPLPLSCPGAGIAPFGSCSPVETSKARPANAPAYSTDLDVAMDTIPSSPCQYKMSYNSTGRALPAPWHPRCATSALAPKSHSMAPEAGLVQNDNEPIPSYMTPQAIRARNIILACPIRTKRPNKVARAPQPSARHVSYPENPEMLKRRKPDRCFCSRCFQRRIRPSG